MITGKFFYPQRDDGKEVDSQVFRYKPVWNVSGNDDDSDFPIFVVIKNNSIEFNFQGKIESGINSHGNSTLSETPYIFTSSPILYIPLSEINYKESRNEVNNIYNRPLSIIPWEDYEVSSPGEPELAYSSMPVFGLSPGIDWKMLNWKNESQSVSTKLEKKLLRKLLLDFIDDFFNANVFMHSAKYHSVKKKILDVYLLKAIYLKADFYLKNKLLSTADKHDKLAEPRYFNALDEWTKFIVNKKNHSVFSLDKHHNKRDSWLDFSDAELTSALIWNRNFPKIGSPLKKEIVKRSVNELVTNYEIVKATVVILCAWNYVLAWIFLGIGIFLASYLTSFYYDSGHLPTGSVTAFIFFISMAIGPSLINAVMLRIPRSIRIPSLPQVLIVISPVIFWTYWLWNDGGISVLLNSDWHWLVIYLILLSCIGITFFILSLVYFGPTVNILMPRLQMAVITAWIAIFTNLDTWKNCFDVSVENAFLYGGLLLMFTACYMLFEIRKNSRLNNKLKIVWKLLNIILPGLVLSLTMGLLGMSMLSQRYMTHTNFFEDKVVRKNVFELQQYDQNKKNFILKNPERDQVAAEQKWITQFGDSFEQSDSIFSVRNRFHLTDGDGKRSSQKMIYDVTVPIFKHKLHIMPGFLILMSCAALFSGIFLTLLFDDKPLTDPL